MTATTLILGISQFGLSLTKDPQPSALASVTMLTQYAFDDNVVAKINVIDDKSVTNPDDPLNNLIFNITFADKVDGGVISTLSGRLYVEGGVDALQEKYPSNFGYIVQKLDFHGALDGEHDFFDAVETRYSTAQATAIRNALNEAGALNTIGAYRKKEAVLAVPASNVADVEPSKVRRSLLDMAQRPRYLICAEIDNLPMIEALAEVVDKLNCHLAIDIGEIADWEMAVAVAESLNIQDYRIQLFWNPNRSRPTGATTLLARKKWRPCVGDYLGKLLLRNANTNASGIPPINRPVAGFYFPLSFRDLEKLPGVDLDEEAQNALAEAHINVVLNEQFEGGSRWIFGDALTLHDSKTSALKLSNAAEIVTYTDNLVVGIAKKHLLKGMQSYIEDATREIERALDSCVGANLLTASPELGGKYYQLLLTPRKDAPFEKVDIKFIRRPEGCARQAYLETTVTK
ncbi:MAG: hypothetical protein Q4P13_05980 [Psychrobacter sp.]|nr:hypothetical protein [Psychrobacter sp.]